MISDRLRSSTDARRFYLVLGCLIVAAWVLLLALQESAFSELIGHEAIEYDGFPPAVRLVIFLLGWFLMLVAMMLPGSLPTLDFHADPFHQRLGGNYLTGLIILGYLFPWFLFGLLVYLGDSFLHRLFAPAAPLAAFSGLIPPAFLLVAGLYQFTPVKRRSTAHCQPTLAPFSSVSVEKISVVDAWKQGLRLGSFCVGSCGSLMLLMVALGHNRLDWMFVLGWIMAAERLAPWGGRLTWLLGFVLIVWAVFWVLVSQHI